MIYLETSVSRCLLKGPNTHQLSGLTEYRGQSPSPAKIAKVELALIGVALLATIELATRIVMMILASPMLVTKKSRKFYFEKLGISTLMTGSALLGAIKGLFTNLTGTHKSTRGNNLKV